MSEIADSAAPQRPSPSTRRGVAIWRRVVRHPRAIVGGTIVLTVVIVAMLAPLIAPQSFDTTDLFNTWAPASAANLLGTDNLGRDILSRLIYGAQTELIVSLCVLAITLAVGVFVGMVAGYYGGFADTISMRTVDIVLAFPEVVFAILVAAALGPGMTTVIVALSLVWWPGIARLTRSLVLVQRNELFIDAAIIAGTPTHLILLRHLIPNIAPAIVVRAAVGVGYIIMSEATLSFLGLGIQEPQPSWGSMIRDGLTGIQFDPTLACAASLVLAFTIIGFNLLGDGIRDILDHKLEER